MASELYDLRMLRAVSVGFIAKQYGKTTNDRGEEKTNYSIIEKSELLEVSGVAVPANPDALAILEEKGLLTKCINKNFINFKVKEEKQETEKKEDKQKKEDIESLVKRIEKIEKILLKLVKEDNTEKEVKEETEEDEELKMIKNLRETKIKAQEAASELSEILREVKKYKD